VPVTPDPDVFHAYWDFQAQPYALGDTITWQVRACALATLAGKKYIDLHILADPLMPAFASQMHTITQWNFKSHLAVMLPAFFLNPMLRSTKLYFDRRAFEEHYFGQIASGATVEPTALAFVRNHTFAAISFDSINIPVRECFVRTGGFPRPCVPASVASWAKAYLASHSRPFVLCVHMRMRKASQDAAVSASSLVRDGCQESWTDFLSLLAQRHPSVLVVVLGQPGEWPRAFMRLPNVILLKSQGSGLLEEMAMIQEADLFMGTVSGPAEFAYFGIKPYIIIDTPDFHPHSTRLRGISPDAQRPPFGVDGQRLHVGRPSAQELLDLFESSYRDILAKRTAPNPSLPAAPGKPG
jgi:hypothetical protein